MSQIPEWAADGNEVAIRSGAGGRKWKIGRVVGHTKARIHVEIPRDKGGGSYQRSFYLPKYSDRWQEWDSAYPDQLYELEADEAQTGQRLQARMYAADRAQRAAKAFTERRASTVTIKEVEELISQLQHFITFVKAQEVNSAAEAEEGQA